MVRQADNGKQFAVLLLGHAPGARRRSGTDVEGPVHESRRLIEALERVVDQVNGRFARVEQVRKFEILPRALTVEDGELTPTLKLRRRQIADNWAEVIEGIYSG